MTPRAAGSASIVAGVSVVGVCMLLSPLRGHPGSWLTPATVALLIVLAVLAGSAGWNAYRHHRFSSQLRAIARPTSIGGIEVQELAGVDGAFVAGLRRPQIFWSADLNARLRADELRAVLLHERYHQLDRAPAKLIMLETVAPALSWFRDGEAWLARQIGALEIAADRHARQQGTSRAALARALLKLAPMRSGSVGIGFASAIDLRLRALLDERPAASSQLALGWVLAPLAAAAFCLLLVMPS